MYVNLHDIMSSKTSKRARATRYYLDLLPAEELSDLLGQLPELAEVDLAALDAVGAALVQEVHVLDEQAEERDDDLETEQ